MINPEDEVIYDHRLSCTEEEAVAKLLGWMQGSKRLRYLTVTDDGLVTDQLAHMYELPSPIAELIREKREIASVRLHNACAAMDFEVAAKWEKAVEYWDGMNERAMRYKQGLAAELSRPKSRLISDKSMTEETGVHHITLRSLDFWARTTYGIDILGQEQQAHVADLPAAPKQTRVKGLQKEGAIIEAIKQLGHTPEQLPPRIPGKTWIKAEVWENLNERHNTLFRSRNAFDKTWDALRQEKRIAESECPPK